MKKIIIALLMLPFAVILSACSGHISISDSNPVDNAYSNEFANGTEFEEGLWRTDDALYIRRFSRNWDWSLSSYTSQKIYKLTDAGQELIYSDETENAYSSELQMRMYHGEFLDYYLHTDTESGHPEIWRLNMDSRQFEKYIELDPPDGTVAYRFFVLENQLYFLSSTEQIEDGNFVYRYDDGTYTLLASNETFGKMFLPVYFSNHDMYYVLLESFEQIGDNQFDTFYIYDLKSKKNVKEYQLDFIAEMKKNGKGEVYNTLFTDNYLYFNCRFESTGTYTLYRTNLNDMETTKIVDNSGCRMNSCGDTLYLAISYDALDTKSTLHILTPESDTPREICNINLRNIYLVDDKWVYFSDYGNTIYRVLPSGENLQKVM